MKRLIAFDLDGTLAESKQPLAPEMAGALADLLSVADVAIISGGDWPQFAKQVVRRLPRRSRRERLWLMPTTGAKLYRFHNHRWGRAYADLLTADEKRRIVTTFDDAIRRAGLATERTWGKRLEDRGTQFTFSGLGQDAPLAAKEKWDPDRRKRIAMAGWLRRALPDLSVALGGTTSIDVTRKGVDKAYALRRLADASGIPIAAMLFLGDAIYPGGNDEAALASGVEAIKVHDPQDTATAIAAIVACLRAP